MIHNEGKNHGGAVQDNAETLSEVPILCDPNSPNWNCSSIPIPELELELKLVELKMEMELKSLELELELKTGIELFATATEALTSLPTISKFSFNRGGHNLSCG